jgi:hypothetical protein
LTNTAYSIGGVVGEIRDAATKAYLQVLPFDFKLREPNSDAIKFGKSKNYTFILILVIITTSNLSWRIF